MRPMQDVTRRWLTSHGIPDELITPNAAQWAVDINLDPWTIVVHGAELGTVGAVVPFMLYLNGSLCETRVLPEVDALARIQSLVRAFSR